MAVTPITWRNINQDTGVRDALSATIAAQNSMNSSVSALDKILGQQQDIAQRGIDEQRLTNENAFLRELQSRDPDAIRAAQADGTLDSLFGQLTPQQQNRLMPAQNTALASAQGFQTSDRQEITGNRAFGTQELAYNMRHDLASAERLGLLGDGEKLKELVYAHRDNPDAMDLLAKAYSNAAVAGEDRMLTVNEKRAKINLANANTSLTAANTQDTLAGVEGTIAKSKAAVLDNTERLASANAAFNLQGNIYTPARGGAIRDKDSRANLIKEFTATYGDPENKMAVRARLLIGKAPDQVEVTVNGRKVVVPVPTAVAKNAIKDELTNNIRWRHNNAVDSVNNKIIRIMETTPEYLDAWDQFSYSQPTAMLRRK